MSKLTNVEEREYAELADHAERGELKPVGETLRGEAAASMAREMILEATGASSVEEASELALGRPRLGDEGQETKTWKVRTPAALDQTVREAAHRRGMSVFAYIRLAAARHVESDAVSA